jgi:hypothetical protein
LSHNQDDFSATQTCDPELDYIQPIVAEADEETPTTPISAPGQARHVTVGPGKKTVELYYDAMAERDALLRKKIAELLNQ